MGWSSVRRTHWIPKHQIMKLEYNNGELTIDPVEFFDCLNEEDKKDVAKNLATQDFIMNKAIDFLCGEDEEGWFDGLDSERRQKILEKVEDAHIREPKHNWSVFRDLRDQIKYDRSSDHIYWALYHHRNQDLTIREFMLNIKDESQFMTNRGEKDIERLDKLIDETFKKIEK